MSAAPAGVFQSDQTRAELLAHAPDGAGPGRTVWLGLRLDHAPHWHTYWSNPGTGLPTTLEWKLPAGWTAGGFDDAAWPAPVWGKCAPVGYTDDQLQAVRQRLRGLQLAGYQEA